MYELIKNELEAQGKSFYWLSKQTGVSLSIFSLLKKRKSLSAENLKKVAAALEKPMEFFMSEAKA